MANIYENAVLTLAAASSSDSSGGLFRQNVPHLLLRSGQDRLGQAALRRFSNPSFFRYNRSPPARQIRSDPDETSPLFERAWVYQERLLSRRIVYFTPLELVFECRESNTTESGYPWIDSEPKTAFTAVYDPDVPSEWISTLWRNLVNDFTSLKLTLEKDTLPAMAGIATRFKKRGETNDYLAGAWRETFIEDLL
jgi:hypothetical protein